MNLRCGKPVHRHTDVITNKRNKVLLVILANMQENCKLFYFIVKRQLLRTFYSIRIIGRNIPSFLPISFFGLINAETGTECVGVIRTNGWLVQKSAVCNTKIVHSCIEHQQIGREFVIENTVIRTEAIGDSACKR